MPVAEHEQMTALGILLKLMLGQREKSIETLAHVRDAGQQENPRGRTQREHRLWASSMARAASSPSKPLAK
jgi:hypothetical protein